MTSLFNSRIPEVGHLVTECLVRRKFTQVPKPEHVTKEVYHTFLSLPPLMTTHVREIDDFIEYRRTLEMPPGMWNAPSYISHLFRFKPEVPSGIYQNPTEEERKAQKEREAAEFGDALVLCANKIGDVLQEAGVKQFHQIECFVHENQVSIADFFRQGKVNGNVYSIVVMCPEKQE